MPEKGDFDAFVPGGLANLGIEVDEAELGVMRVVHEVYWPTMRALLEADLPVAPPEPGPDLSHAPQ